MSNVLYMVMCCHDVTDFDSASVEYNVCWYPTKDQAQRHADRATAMSATMPTTMMMAPELEQYAKDHPAMFELDPYWSVGHTRPNTYYVEAVGKGVRDVAKKVR